MNAKKGSKKFSFDVRGVEAWAEPEGGWTWNQSWHLGTMETAGDPRQALPDFLRRHCQIRMKRGFSESSTTERLSKSDTEKPTNQYLQQSRIFERRKNNARENREGPPGRRSAI